MKRLLPVAAHLSQFGDPFGFHVELPPTEQDAIAVWKNTHAKPHIGDLLNLKKTNGQMQESNGVPVYALYYQAEDKTVVPLGNSPAGIVNSHQGSYAFQWTEKGWLGPDNHVYPVH